MTGGFHPPMLAAWAYARARRRAHVALSDGWVASEVGLSAAHRAVRHVVYRSSDAYVGASEKTLQLFEAYGARRNLFVAPLGVDNAAFARSARPMAERRFDLMFAGNLIDRKLPLFFADVAIRVAERHSIEVLVVGDGPLRDQLVRKLGDAGVRATFTGYLQQTELPAMYGNARLLCFPTQNDPWGVVANEASAAGTPVVTCANAGCAGELVAHEQSGLVLPLDAAEWAMRIVGLLGDEETLGVFGRAAQQRVAGYSFDAAADAMLASCRAALAGA
jgi:glycosyltransferase involved in cell wall biosynthesis